MGRGGPSASVTPAGDGGGAAAAPRPGNKRARCGSAPAASGEETRAPHRPTPTPSRDPAPVRSRRPRVHSSASRSGSQPVAAASARPTRAAPAERSVPATLLLPALVPGVWPSKPSALCPLRAGRLLAYALAPSGSLSARQHELQRRVPPADQHAGPYDPRRVRPRPALRDDLRRRRWRRRRWRRGHHQDVLLPALHGQRPELGRLLVGTRPVPERAACAGLRGLRALLSGSIPPAGEERDRSPCPGARRTARLPEVTTAFPVPAGAGPRGPDAHGAAPAGGRVRAVTSSAFAASRGWRPACEGPGRGGRGCFQDGPLHGQRGPPSPLSRPAGGRPGRRGCDETQPLIVTKSKIAKERGRGPLRWPGSDSALHGVLWLTPNSRAPRDHVGSPRSFVGVASPGGAGSRPGIAPPRPPLYANEASRQGRRPGPGPTPRGDAGPRCPPRGSPRPRQRAHLWPRGCALCFPPSAKHRGTTSFSRLRSAAKCPAP